MTLKKVEFRRLVKKEEIGSKYDLTITITIEPELQQTQPAGAKAEKPEEQEWRDTLQAKLYNYKDFIEFVKERYGKNVGEDYDLDAGPEKYTLWLKKYWGKDAFGQILDDFKPWGAKYGKDEGRWYIEISKSRK